MQIAPQHPRRHTWIIAVVLICFASLAASASACPSCKAALPNEIATQTQLVTSSPDTAKGYAWSIFLMMAMPYALLGGVGLTVYFHYRQRPPASLPRP